MLAKDLSYELSIRLGDPIAHDPINADAQGLVFSGEQRLRYISRAYSKLTRMLKILMRDYQPEFNKRRNVNGVNLAGIPPGVTHFAIIENNNRIEEVYVTYKYTENGVLKEKKVAATYMEPSKYLSTKYDPNDVKTTSFPDGKIKYTLMIVGSDWTINLLPVPNESNYYTYIEYLEVPDFIIDSWEKDVPITGDYIDLLIDLAAIQGMQDIARADKAQLISQSIQTDWQILGQYGTYMKQTEGVKE